MPDRATDLFAADIWKSFIFSSHIWHGPWYEPPGPTGGRMQFTDEKLLALDFFDENVDGA